MIQNSTDIIKGEYLLKNYTSLSTQEKELVLEYRNKNRKWMIEQDLILLQEHLQWIESLKNDHTKLNFLVYKNETPFIAIAFHDITEDEAFWGYYMINDAYKSEVLKIEQLIIDIAFNDLGVKKLLCINDINNHVINIHKFFGFKEDGVLIINDRNFLRMSLEKEIS